MLDIAVTPFTRFQTRDFGNFKIAVFRLGKAAPEHVVLTRGGIRGVCSVPTRISSECVTGTALNSATCDCAQQNAVALSRISASSSGIFVYLRQEGRGHGLFTKIRALREKNRGVDTFEAVEKLGLSADIRRYEAAAAILQLLAPRSIVLLSANPEKYESLLRNSVQISKVEPIWIRPTPATAMHLRAKRERGFFSYEFIPGTESTPADRRRPHRRRMPLSS